MEEIPSAAINRPPENDSSFGSRTIFVGDLSYFCNDQHLRQIFEPFGPLEMVQVKTSKGGQPHLAYGFVRFSNPNSAVAAIKAMDGYILLGRAIRVGWASDNPDQKLPNSRKRPDKSKSDPTAQIHVSFTARDPSYPVTEATLRELYSRFGELVDVTIKKTVFNKVNVFFFLIFICLLFFF